MKTKEFLNGLRAGLPIALGYIPVSFSFGMICTQSCIPLWAALAISMTNLTSAGQFAGIHLIAVNAPLTEIAVVSLVINLRYMLMSLALSQKLERMPLIKRMLISFGITDEIFSVASTRIGRVGFWYMLGLILTPYIGWSAGTLLGSAAGGILPGAVVSCMGIALYAMFLAIFIPASKKQKSILAVVIFAAAVSCILKYTPILSSISAGWATIIATITASAFGACVFPHREEKK
jgi:predicted branched-subunit amino acid permease